MSFTVARRARLAVIALVVALLGPIAMLSAVATPPPAHGAKATAASAPPRSAAGTSETRGRPTGKTKITTPADPSAERTAADEPPKTTTRDEPARRDRWAGRRVPVSGAVATIAGARGGREVAHDADRAGVLRLTPGRYRPTIEPPGGGVPVEAVVSWAGDAAAAPALEDVRVFVHVRAHPLLEWDTIEMRPVPTSPERFQAALPCAPCHARPEFWLQAVLEGPPRPDGAVEAWWPAAGPSLPAIYDVGHERVLASVPGAVLSFDGRSGPRGGGDGGGGGGGGRGGHGQPEKVGGSFPDGSSEWRSPAWPVGGADVTLVAMEWRLDAGPDDDATLVVAVRPGGIGPWTVVERLKRPRQRWMTLTIPVHDHLRHPAEVQVRAWIEGPHDTVVQLSAVRLVEIGCTAVSGPDVNDDGAVGLEDLLLVITALGPCEAAGGCPADVDGDGLIDLADALAVLAAWEPAEIGGRSSA